MSSTAPRHPHPYTRQANVVHPDPPSKGYQPKTRHDIHSDYRTASETTSPRLKPATSYYNLYRQTNRSNWPPRPTVVDVSASSTSEDVPHRGSIDQEPILVEVENTERRFTFANSKAGQPSDRSVNTETRRNRSPRRRPPLIDLAPPEEHTLPQRQPSPYAFVRTPEKMSFERPTESRRRSPTATIPDRQTSPTSRPTSYRRARTEADGYASMSSLNTDDSEGEPLKSALKRSGSQKFNKNHVHFGKPSSAAPVPLHTPQVRSTPPSPRASLSDLSGEEGTTRKASAHHYRDQQRASTFPLREPNRSSSGGTHHKQSDNLRKDSVHELPSAHSTPRQGSQPSSSPRSSHYDSPHSSVKDSPSSRRSTPASSPASSPRNSTYEVHSIENKPIRPTPLSTSTRQESADKMPRARSPQPVRRSRSNLPYPMDDVDLRMPHEGHFQAPAVPSHSRPATSNDIKPSSTSARSSSRTRLDPAKESLSPRPALSSRKSALETPTRRFTEPPRSSSVDPTAKSRSTSSSTTKYEPAKPCQRDSIRYGAKWHYIPDEPEATICTECYGTHVLPLINRGTGSKLAYSFNRTAQPLSYDYHPEKGMPADGATCQLYSARMQRVFARAVKHDDLTYLLRKVAERRKVEASCRRRQGRLVDMLERGRGLRGDDEQAVLRELKAIQGEWAEWE